MERRIFIASVMALDNLSSNLRIIILRLITKLIFKQPPISHQSPYMQINVLIDGTKGLYFLIKNFFKSTY